MAIADPIPGSTQSVLDIRFDQPADQLELASTQPGPYTGIVVFDGKAWTALCRELDIASEGTDHLDAYQNLRAAVREALQVAAERNLQLNNRRVLDAELAAFMKSAKAPYPVWTFHFSVD